MVENNNNYDVQFLETTRDSDHVQFIDNEMKEITAPASDGKIYAGEYSREIMDNKTNDKVSIGYATTSSGELAPIKYDIYADRMLHTGLFGGTGSGKTTLKLNYMVQLANKGYGFTFIDPKVGKHPDAPDDFPNIGEDALNLLRMLPEHRIPDVEYINPIPIADYSISMNPLEIQDYLRDSDSESEFEDAISGKQELMKAIMMSSASSKDMEAFGATMERAFEGLVQSAMRSEEKFTFADIHMMLSNPDMMEKFYERLAQELEDELILDETKNVSEMEEGELESILRRTQRLVTKNLVTRDFIVNEETDINFKDSIENNKIFIVDIQSKSEPVLNTCVGYVITSLFNAAKKAQLNKPHILFGDEFHKVAELKQFIPLEDILSEGRSNKFLLFYSTQSPNRIRDFVKESKTNLGTAISGRISHDGAQSINKLFINEEGDPARSDSFTNLPQYTFYSSRLVDGAGYHKVKAHAPYPPRRSIKEAAKLAALSVRKYGSKHKRKRTYEDTIRDFIRTDSRTLTQREGLRAIYTAQIFDEHNGNNYDLESFASVDTIKNVVDVSCTADINDINLESWLERQESVMFVESKKKDGEIYYKITNQGLEYIAEDTGKGASAGGDEHRSEIQEVRNTFAKYGIAINTPTQDQGGELPDALGYIFEVTDETPLTDKYDIGDEITIEIEKETTQSKTYKMMVNFAKTDSNVVFVCNETSIADKIDEKLHIHGGTTGKEEVFGTKLFNKNELLKSDQIIPLRNPPAPKASKSNSWSRWYLDGDTLRFAERKANGELVEGFNLHPDTKIEDWHSSDFPVYAQKKADGYVVKDNKTGETYGPFESIDEIEDKSGYYRIKQPWVPSVEFDKEPTRDNYDIILLPDAVDSFSEPHIYDAGSYYSLGDSVTDGTEVEAEENTVINVDDGEEERSDEEEDDIDDIDTDIDDDFNLF